MEESTKSSSELARESRELCAKLAKAQEEKDSYRTLIDRVHEGAAILAADGAVLYCNQRLAYLAGVLPSEVLGRPIVQFIAPEGRDGFHALLVQALRGQPSHAELNLQDSRSQRVARVRVSLKAVDGESPAALAMMVDDFAESQINRALRARSNTNRALLHAATEGGLLQEVCQIITEDCGYAMVWIGFAEDDEKRTVRPVAWAGHEAGYLETAQVSWADTERGRGPTGVSIRTGKPCGCPDVLTHPMVSPWRAEAIQRGYASSLALPLLEDGKAFGAITIYSPVPNAFSSEEFNLLVELAADFSYGISALRVRAARDRAEKALRQSQEWLRVTLGSIGDAVLATDTRGRITFLNPVAAALTGWSPEAAEGQPIQSVFQVIDQQTSRAEKDIVARVLQEGRAFELTNHTVLITKDGRRVPVEDSAAPIVDNDGRVIGVVLVFHDVTEKRRGQEALRRAEAELKEAQRLAHVGNWYWDPETDSITGSEEFFRIHGLNPRMQLIIFRDMRGRFYPAEDWDRLQAARQKTLQTGTGYQLEVQVNRAGARAWLTTRGEAVRDSEQKIVGLRGTVQDITERKRAEEELRRGEEARKVAEAVKLERQRLYDVLETLPAMVCLLSPDYHVVFANRSFRERYGESNGRHCYEYRFGSDGPCAFCETFRVMKTGQPHHWELHTRDGHIVSVYDFPFLDVDGSPLVLEMGIDITEQRRAEAELKKHRTLLEDMVRQRTSDLRALNLQLRADIAERRRVEEDLRQTSNILLAISKHTPDLIFAKDRQGRIVHASDSVLRLLGKSVGEVLGKTDAECHTDPRLGEAVMENERIVRETGRPLVVEELAALPDGTVRTFLSTKVPWLGENGSLLGTFSISVDITERKRSDQALLRSEKLAAVGRMAASIAHEINNPLSAVMNTIYLAKASLNEYEKEALRQYLDLADDELRRISHITRQTLGFYRESSVPIPVSMNTILDSVVDLLRGKIRVKNAIIQKQYAEEEDVRIPAIGGELRQIFSNLLANSLDAIQERGIVTLRVSRSTFVNSGQSRVRVTVADNGKGIDAAMLPHIFEPLFTTKEATGSGLGLWVSKQLIEKHGGSIQVRTSTQGERRGTTFSVLIPGTGGPADEDKATAAL